MQFSKQGVSFTGLTVMGEAGASQALVPGWVNEEQLKAVLPLCPALCLWEAGWRGGLCALISPGLCFLGHPHLLFQLCCFCTREALDAAGPAPHGPLISLSPRAAAQLCLTPWGFGGCPVPQGWAESLGLGVIVTILPALGKVMGFGSCGCAVEPGDRHRL